MGGLSGLANIGHFAGGAVKGYDAAEEQRLKQEEHDFKMQERARDVATAAAVAKASGMTPEQFTQGDSTFAGMTGGLDSQDIPRETTTGYRMGGQEQATPFTPEQVQGIRSQGIRTALQQRGNIQSLVAADTLDTNAQARELGGLKIKGAKRTESEADQAATARGFMADIARGVDPVEVFRKASQMNGAIPNGFHTSEPVQGPDGAWQTILTNEKTGETKVYPVTGDTVGKMLKHLHTFSSEAAFNKATEDAQKDRKLGIEERTATTAEKKQASDEKVAGAHITYYDRAGRAALISASNKGESKPSWQIVGTDSDGEAVQHDKTSGTFKRRDGGKIQDVDFFKKITGSGAVAADPIREGMIKGIATGTYRPEDIIKYDADKASQSRKAGAIDGSTYTPGARPGAPPGPAQGGLPGGVEGPQFTRNPGESQAAFRMRSNAAARAAQAERERMRREEYGVIGAQEETNYGLRGVDPRRPAFGMP